MAGDCGAGVVPSAIPIRSNGWLHFDNIDLRDSPAMRLEFAQHCVRMCNSYDMNIQHTGNHNVIH
jgi:hypothetical protein